MTPEDVNMNPFLVLFFLFEVIAQSWGVKPIDVYWNITNPIFSGGEFGSQFENVIELNKDTHPWEYDQVSQLWVVYINSVKINHEGTL